MKESKKTFQLVVRDDFQSIGISKTYERAIIQAGWIKSDQPDVVIAIGGDGTVLHAYKQYNNENTCFLGLGTGSLGFYADWGTEESGQLLDKILTEEYETVSYPLVEFELYFTDGQYEKRFALNEGILKTKTLSTMVVDVCLNEKHFETFRGDGLIISTPSGSTAYNYSVGGAIIHPSIEALQVSELAAINNIQYRTLGRSFVLPKHHTLDIFPKSNSEGILFGLDGYESFHSPIRRIQAKVSEQKVRFVRYESFPFWERVKDKFIK